LIFTLVAIWAPILALSLVPGTSYAFWQSAGSIWAAAIHSGDLDLVETDFVWSEQVSGQAGDDQDSLAAFPAQLGDRFTVEQSFDVTLIGDNLMAALKLLWTGPPPTGLDLDVAIQTQSTTNGTVTVYSGRLAYSGTNLPLSYLLPLDTTQVLVTYAVTVTNQPTWSADRAVRPTTALPDLNLNLTQVDSAENPQGWSVTLDAAPVNLGHGLNTLELRDADNNLIDAAGPTVSLPLSSTLAANVLAAVKANQAGGAYLFTVTATTEGNTGMTLTIPDPTRPANTYIAASYVYPVVTPAQCIVALNDFPPPDLTDFSLIAGGFSAGPTTASQLFCLVVVPVSTGYTNTGTATVEWSTGTYQASDTWSAAVYPDPAREPAGSQWDFTATLTRPLV
jgi:alternate signal-mediated exported protein